MKKILCPLAALALGLIACAPVATVTPRAVPETYAPCPAAENLALPVLQGKDGWLFNNIDIIQRFEPGVPIAGDFQRLLEAFKAQGITLVAVVLPTHGSVYSDELGESQAAYDPGLARTSYRDFLAQLRAVGVIAPDLTPLVRRGGPFYLKRDQHWTSAGARRVARLVAAQLRPLAAYDKLEKSTFRSRSLGFVEQKGWLQENVETACAVTLPDERVELFSTALDTSGRSAADALFADLGSPPVTLIGTSNSHRLDSKPDSNFSGFCVRPWVSRC